MSWKRWVLGIGLYVGATYVIDVPLRRARAAYLARAYANARGRPLLNVGAGTSTTALFGPTLYGDVNVDLAGRRDVPHGTPGIVTFADAADLSAFPDGAFGAVLASHILDRLPDPGRALSEWLRVVGGDGAALFVVTPLWWAPYAWFHPANLWFWADACGGCEGAPARRLRQSMSPTMQRLTTLRGLR